MKKFTIKNSVSLRKGLIISICVMMMLIAGFFGMVGTASAGNTYYVASDGNDSNSGTEAQQWKTIQKAADTLIAGDTVYIKEGTYNEQVIPQNSGSPGNYITYTAYPGDTVTIDGDGVPLSAWRGLFEADDKSYIKISGLRIINSDYFGITIRDWGVNKAHHFIIENNYIHNCQASGIHIFAKGSTITNIIIDNNEVSEVCMNMAQEAVTLCAVDTFEVKNNHVHHSYKEGIDAKVGCSNGKIYKNHVHNIDAVGIYLDAGWDEGGVDNYEYNIDAYQNIVHNNGAIGIGMATEVATGRLENINIYNNIIYNNRGGGTGIYEAYPGTLKKDLRIINNIVYNNGLYGITCKDEQVENFIIRNNIVSQNEGYQIQVGPAIDRVTVDHNLIDGFTEVTGDYPVIGDPKFVNPSEADFHLQADSPAIDKGSHVDAPDDDYDGNSRPQGAGYDIGAYECEHYGGTCTLLGTVSSAGNPIPNATVTVAEHETTTNDSGNYLMELPPGTYTITASAEEYEPASENVTIEPANTQTLNFSLSSSSAPLHAIYGFVFLHDNITPAADININVTLIHVHEHGNLSTTTASDGSYSFDLGNLPSYNDSDPLQITASSGKSIASINITVNTSIEPQKVPDLVLNVAPTISLTSPANGTLLNYSSVTLRWASSDDDGDVLSHTVIIDSSPYDAGSSSFYTIALEEGIHSWKVVVSDSFTSIESETRTFTIDTTPPIVTINPVTSPTNITTQIISGSFFETGSGTKSITVNGIEATISGSTFSANVSLSKGKNSVTVTATDKAGNSASQSVSIIVHPLKHQTSKHSVKKRMQLISLPGITLMNLTSPMS